MTIRKLVSEIKAYYKRAERQKKNATDLETRLYELGRMNMCMDLLDLIEYEVNKEDKSGTNADRDDDREKRHTEGR